jgi:hypothetical protein
MLPSGAAIPTEVGSCEPVVSTIPRSSGTRGSASTSPLVRLAALPKTS